MPLHDWSDPRGWDGVRLLWITELLRWVKPRLPAEYRVYIGYAPTLTIGSPSEMAAVVCQPQPNKFPPSSSSTYAAAKDEKPDEEIALAYLEPVKAVYVEIRERLVAIIELLPPRDNFEGWATGLMRYLNYLYNGIHMLLVDVHRRPMPFAFADQIASELGMRQPPSPMAVSYRVSDLAATGGRNLAIWRRPLTVGAPLPTLPLFLDVGVSVPVDLEQTYMHAAADVYLT